jgi:predicted nuclease of predicted toxin-antitoxin system
MALKLYLDEDVDPLLAPVLRDRGIDCLSTREAGNLGIPDLDQLAFATSQRRALLTFNVKDFVRLARNYAAAGKPHTGIIVSNHIPFHKLLRRILLLFKEHGREDLTDKLLWLQDYEKRPDFS